MSCDQPVPKRPYHRYLLMASALGSLPIHNMLDRKKLLLYSRNKAIFLNLRRYVHTVSIGLLPSFSHDLFPFFDTIKE